MPEKSREKGKSAKDLKKRPFRRFLLLLVATSIFAGFFSGRYLMDLDRRVHERFSGKLFRVPTRVYASGTVIYPGLNLERSGVWDHLDQLAYREAHARQPLRPGQYSWRGDALALHRRAFHHPNRPEPAKEVVVSISGEKVSGIIDQGTGREVGAFILEPVPVGTFYGPERERREIVKIQQVPNHLIDAIFAVEDQRFLEHRGIDLRRILGALIVNVKAGGVRQGGSTLTQQLVKNFFLTPERTLKRKVQEALMALLVEIRYDKTEILVCYLNEIYLGQRGGAAVHGVGEAAFHYFGKPVSELTLSEAALIAAIIQSPNGLSPRRQPDKALKRRNLVLELMYKQGRIHAGQLRGARRVELELAPLGDDLREARYFIDMLRRQLPEFYAPEILTSEGLRIYTSLDLRIQRIAARALGSGLKRLEDDFPALLKRDDLRIEGCLIALRPQTGEVIALVGGRSYATSQFDRCSQAKRPSGSVFKPFVYLAALEPRNGAPGITLASRLDDSPFQIESGGKLWKPFNYDREFHGIVGVRGALERSFNVATARLGNEIGIQSVAEMAYRLGVERKLPPFPSLAIGAADLSPIELVRAYGTIANGGVRPEVRSFKDIVDSHGVTLSRQQVKFERVLDAGTAFLGTSLLQGVVDRGTARGVRRLGLEGPIAAKTGTSDEESDAWFAGFTPELAIVVWVGFDEPRSLGLPASVAALPIWARFLKEVTGGKVRGEFKPPDQIARVAIDPVSGDRSVSGCPRTQDEYFLLGTEPEGVCGDWIDVREPEESPWLLERLFKRWLDGL